jgi:HSP20 family protein
MQRAMTRWTPADLARDRFGRFFDQAFTDFFNPAVRSEEVSNRDWLPVVDVAENPEALMIHAELPGLSKDDVEITLDNNVLTLKGERKFEKEVKEENYHRIERSYGSFSRSFTLPPNVKTEASEANFKDGVLTIRLPKVEEAKPRKITIG